jgi:hypothetical protein
MLAAAASARVVFRDTFHEEETFVLNDFCDVEGLTVELSFVVDGRVHAVQRGQGAPYFLEYVKRTEVYTNLANGKSVTGVVNALQKDLRITNNGDGTLTITILATGNAVLYDENGTPIARDPGQSGFRERRLSRLGCRTGYGEDARGTFSRVAFDLLVNIPEGWPTPGRYTLSRKGQCP